MRVQKEGVKYYICSVQPDKDKTIKDKPNSGNQFLRFEPPPDNEFDYLRTTRPINLRTSQEMAKTTQESWAHPRKGLAEVFSLLTRTKKETLALVMERNKRMLIRLMESMS